MRVMTTGMHDVNLAAIGETLLRGRRIGQAGRLTYRVGIHIGAEPDGRTGAVLEYAHDAGSGDPFRDGEAQCLEIPGNDGRRARFGERKFRVPMQILEEGSETFRIRIDGRIDFGDQRRRDRPCSGYRHRFGQGARCR